MVLFNSCYMEIKFTDIYLNIFPNIIIIIIIIINILIHYCCYCYYYLISIIIASVSSLIFVNLGFGIIGVAVGFLLSSFFTGSVIFIYAVSHYIKGAFRCLSYLISLYVPILYMITVLLFNEIIISSSFDMLSDIRKLMIKLCILLIFSIPLVYIANKKTGIISEFIDFLKLDRFISKQYKYRLGYAGK